MVTIYITHTGHQILSAINAIIDVRHVKAIPPAPLATRAITLIVSGVIHARITAANVSAILPAPAASTPTLSSIANAFAMGQRTVIGAISPLDVGHAYIRILSSMALVENAHRIAIIAMLYPFVFNALIITI